MNGKTGTLSYEDIYGAGTLDTVPETQQQANPNNSEITGAVTKDKASIFNIKGNIFGQPLTVWFGLVVLLIGIKYIAEKEGA
jgi:hypothetical protein